MKNLLYLISFLTLYSCGAQVIPYLSDTNIFISNSNAYYKDTGNDFDKFQGTWKWENQLNDTELVIELIKYFNLDDGDGFTFDVLSGEYKYIENGIELANTLSNIADPSIEGFGNSINGVTLLEKHNRPLCTLCPVDKKRILLSIQSDDDEGVYGELILQHFLENGIEKLKVIVKDGPWLSQNPNAPEDIDIPFGQYILTKQ